MANKKQQNKIDKILQKSLRHHFQWYNKMNGFKF